MCAYIDGLKLIYACVEEREDADGCLAEVYYIVKQAVGGGAY